jgi:pimeloyl-ACP methyl ester carboxylesterase
MVIAVDVERGSLGPLPFLAVGSGAPLLYLAGLSPEVGVGNGAGRGQIGLMRPFAGVRRVYFVNRRPGLPRGMTLAELAAEHADALRARFDEPVDVLGLSTGGSIAQQLAADHPDVVRRLVLLSTACRLGPAGRELQRRVAARIRAGARRQALALFASDLVGPAPAQLAIGALAWLLGPVLVRGRPGDLDDMATTIEAEDAFDLAALPTVQAPTLIVAGGDDRFYGRELFAETARLIPDSRLLVLERRGHVTVMGDARYPAAVRELLAASGGDPRRGSATGPGARLPVC